MSEWDEYAAGWDGDEATRAYARAAHDSLMRVLSRAQVASSEMAVCDFGCGTGLLTEKLAPVCAHIDAIDTSTEMLRVLQGKLDARGWGHVRALGEPPADAPPYDLIVCSSVCAFLDDYPATVKGLVARMAPAALFVQWDWEAAPGAQESGGLTRDAITACLRDAGLEVLTVETAFSVDVGGQSMRPLLGVGRKPA